MKKLLLVLLLISGALVYGQAPDMVNYQGIARNSAGNVLPNKNISVRLSVRDGSGAGTVVYSETRKLSTNSFGLFTIAIGSQGASNVAGSIAGINWASGSKFLQVEIDPAGGSNFANMGAAQLLSVPYALYAGNSSSSAPVGPAGGDLFGNYPNPTIKDGAVTINSLANNSVSTFKLIDGSVTAAKIAPGVIPTSLPPNGNAGGDLNGTYPNPTIKTGAVTSAKLADNSVATSKLVDGSVTAAKIAAGVIPSSLPPGGTAGGDLSGTYPNPSIKNGAVKTAMLVDGSVTLAKIAPGVIPASLPPTGAAGGDLSGTYPNPTIKAGAVTTTTLADNSVSTFKLINGSVTAAKIAAGVIPTSLPPSGTAGGDLNGTYPNPTIKAGAVTTTSLADNSVSTFKLIDGSVTAAKIAAGVIPTSLPPTGAAGGDLTGTYPNPGIKDGAVTTIALADNSVSTFKLMDGSVTAAKIAAGVIPASLPPSGTAGGDLTGTYPNPTIATGAVTTTSLANNSVSTFKLIDGSVTAAKIAAGVIPTTLPPSGAAGGDLAGTYPNPTVKDGSITNTKLADDAVTTAKVADASITMAKLGPDVVLGGGGAPSGPAGGDLNGTYPNPNLAAGSVTVSKIANGAINTPKIADGAVNGNKLADNSISTIKIIDAAVTAAKLAPGVIPTSLPPTGAAGGDLNGTYPNPTIKAGAVITTSLADNSVSTFKLIDGSVTAAKIAAGVIPTTLPPTGAAGGDLSGSYPNPLVSKINGITINTTAPASGQVLKYNGSQWAPAADNTGGGGLTLPFSQSLANASNLLSLTNTGTGAGLEGVNSSNNGNAFGVLGKITSTNPGSSSTAIRGINSGVGIEGMGIWGSHDGYGKGVYGSSVAGSGIHGFSNDGPGIFGTSNNGTSGYFDISNTASVSDALFAYNMGAGAGMTAISENGYGLWGITYSPMAAGIIAYNIGGGEGIVGRNVSNTAGAIVGRNDGTFAGIQGTGAADDATGVLAIANVDGFVNGNALVASLEGPGAGNTAVFKANGSNVARIDETGKGFFNNGTQVGGADVAEFFDVEGSRASYEAGDVLTISQTSDRTVEKSSAPYSTLVAGVFATKPGILLTEKNAEQNKLNDMVPMGVVGVIPTKVCLEGGAIKRGDLIVTSSIPGVAMKADREKVRVGQVIGKALQDYSAEGTGKINILVSIK